MKKKTKTFMTLGMLGAACCGAATYMYMMNNKNKIEAQIKKYMTCPEIDG